MQISMRERIRLAATSWSRHIWILATSVFLIRLGQGLMGGISTNFYVDVLGLSGRQVLWLAGIREIPGLSLMFIAALMMHLPLSRRAALSVFLMGIGYSLYATVHSYAALIAVALIGSLGFHNWMPVQSALGLALTKRSQSGRMLGFLSAMGSLASIVGMGVTAIMAAAIPLRAFYAVAGGFMVLASVALLAIPTKTGSYDVTQPRIILRKKYWLYYILTFFEGSRMQVFGTFGTLILVQNYGLDARAISLIMVASGIVNVTLAPLLGHLLDDLGERTVLSASYIALALCFVGYATLHNVWLLASLLIAINLLVTLRIGLSTYVNRIAPSEEVAPTLAAGVSINHITSVSMSLLAGTLLELVGYEGLCWGAAAIIMLSVPFALAMRVAPGSPQPIPRVQGTP